MSLLPPLAPTFEAALRDVSAKGGQFRIAAARALGDAPPGREAEARAGLLTLARDDDPRIRAEALRSAARAPHPELLVLVHEAIASYHPLVIDAALELAAALPAEGSALLVSALSSEVGEIRFAAARAITLSPFEGAAEALLAAFPDEDDEISAQLARAIGDLRLAPAADALARALASESRALRAEATFALAELGDPRSFPELIRALDQRDMLADAAALLAKHERREALPALERHADRLFVPALDRAILLGALVRLGGHREAELRLSKMLRSFFPTKRAVAVHAIASLGLRSMLPAVRDAVKRGRLPRSLGESVEAELDANVT